MAYSPAYNQSDWLFVIGLRRAHIEVTHDGRLQIKFEESVDFAAKRLRDYVIKESDDPPEIHRDALGEYVDTPEPPP